MTKKKKPLISTTLTCDDCDTPRTFEATTKAKLIAVVEKAKWHWHRDIQTGDTEEDMSSCPRCYARQDGDDENISEGFGEYVQRKLKNRYRRALRNGLNPKTSLEDFYHLEQEQRKQKEQKAQEMQLAGELNTLPAQYARQESDLLVDLQLQTNRLKILTYAQQIKLRFLRMNPQERQLFLNALTADNKNGFGNLFDLERALNESNPNWRSSDAIPIERARVRAITQGKTIKEARIVAQKAAWIGSAIRHAKERAMGFLAKHPPKPLLSGGSTRLQLAGKEKGSEISDGK